MPERSMKSLMIRWDSIKTQYSIFVGYMSVVLRQNPSGLTNADMVFVYNYLRHQCSLIEFANNVFLYTSLAATRFVAVEKKPFHFLHCWTILKDQPKWMDHHMGHQNPPPNPIGTQSNTVDIDAEESVRSSFTSKRPLGHDSSKEKAKKQRSVDTPST
jgi:hypothetical protein